MKYIVIINGIGRSGKDTFVGLCKEVLQPLNVPVYNISSIDPVKDAGIVLGVPRETKTDAVREFWYDIKMAWVKLNDGPFNYLTNEINSKGDGVFFIHIREVDEAVKFKKSFPQTILLEITREKVDELFNRADTQVKKFKYDLQIENNGSIKELKKKAEDFLFKDLGVRVNA
ncbi:MAG: hypothetical protein ACMG57_02640 [Candidatus Dojkabacteria bacterium]